MLFILYGMAAEMSSISRKYFEKEGFEYIVKAVYTPEELQWYTRADKLDVSEEEIKHFDFTYHNQGRSIGFNKQDILAAVRGEKNAILTIATEDVSFIREIKVAYGQYVTVIYTYIEQSLLDSLYRAYGTLNEEEIQKRLSLGHALKQTFLRERSLFDEIVIVDCKDGDFDYRAMELQYADILARARLKERAMNDKSYIELPYRGTLPYLFVSYSHTMKSTAESILFYLQRKSCRVWYDTGLKGGDNWRQILADKISKCSEFLLLFSEAAAKSNDVMAEINAALDCKKKILVVNLDGTPMPLAIKMYLGQTQIVSYDPSNADAILEGILPEIIKQ